MNSPLRLLAVAASLLSAGCIESFNPFPDPDATVLDVPQSRDVPQSQDDAAMCAPLPSGCDPLALLMDSCGSSTCHGADQAVEGSRYEGGDVFGRLVGLPSGQHGGGCSQIPVIDPDDIPNSMMLRTLRGTQGSCGDRMPFSGVATPTQIRCLETWMEREVCLRQAVDAGTPPLSDAGPRVDAGPRRLDRRRDPGPLTAEEASCLGVDAAQCAACHSFDGRFYRFPYWAPGDPTMRTGAAAEACGVRGNRVSAEAAACFGIDEGSCATCHTAGDGELYLRPWNGLASPDDVQPAPPECYDLL